MFLSNPAKSFLAIFVILLAAAGCGWLRTGNDTSVPVIPEPKSKFPFKTREPEQFQCEITQTAGGSVRRTRLARKGDWRRIDFDFGEANQRSVMRTDKEYLIDHARRTYSEKVSVAGNTVEPVYTDLTHEMLFADASRSEFEEVGTEGSLTKYRTALDGSAASEAIVYFDPSIGLPVKQEFFSVNGTERALEFTIELVDFRTDPDADVFELPNDFKKIPIADFYKQR